MGKKNKQGGSSQLGRSLIKDRFGNTRGKKMVSDNSMLHTTEIKDGYDWGRLNLQSVTEESSFQEFLSTAELAGTEFQAEKLNIKFVNPHSNVGLLTKEEFKNIKDVHNKNKDALKIPRRPKWTVEMTPDELDKNEKEHFLEWRKSLAYLQEEKGILLTPYEKNLEFWRQLWRVVERSDIVAQIVDARNPLLFRCEDLEKYVKEVSEHKMNLLLINKADFLTEYQRQIWADYFTSIHVRVLFFSAKLASEITDSIEEEEEEEGKQHDIKKWKEKEEDYDDNAESVSSVRQCLEDLELAVETNAGVLNNIIDKIEKIIGHTNLKGFVGAELSNNTSKLHSREELIDVLRTLHIGPKVTKDITTIGFIGYPNVGKSSTINALMCSKKVSVSATPGKTKHFQTLYLDKDLLLCDCPGLVMPSFVFTKAEMILNGILPIDHMRDHVPPTNLLSSLIPKHVIEDKYGIMLPSPPEGEDPDRSPTAEELLNTYAYNRGFMTANGQPDNPRASRYILKDYMNGKLLYCHAPPNMKQVDYHMWPETKKTNLENKNVPPRQASAARTSKVTSADIDKGFFKSASQGVHAKGVSGEATGSFIGEPNTEYKPWKQHNKHKNKGKKEKLRRVYSHLDHH